MPHLNCIPLEKSSHEFARYLTSASNATTATFLLRPSHLQLAPGLFHTTNLYFRKQSGTMKVTMTLYTRSTTPDESDALDQ